MIKRPPTPCAPAQARHTPKVRASVRGGGEETVRESASSTCRNRAPGSKEKRERKGSAKCQSLYNTHEDMAQVYIPQGPWTLNCARTSASTARERQTPKLKGLADRGGRRRLELEPGSSIGPGDRERTRVTRIQESSGRGPQSSIREGRPPVGWRRGAFAPSHGF